MSKCIECGYEFTSKEKAKAGLSFKGHLKCPKCGSVYKPEGIYRITYFYIVIFTFFFIEYRFDIFNTFIEYIAAGLILTGTLLLFDVIPHRWQKYRQIR